MCTTSLVAYLEPSREQSVGRYAPLQGQNQLSFPSRSLSSRYCLGDRICLERPARHFHRSNRRCAQIPRMILRPVRAPGLHRRQLSRAAGNFPVPARDQYSDHPNTSSAGQMHLAPAAINTINLGYHSVNREGGPKDIKSIHVRKTL